MKKKDLLEQVMLLFYFWRLSYFLFLRKIVYLHPITNTNRSDKNKKVLAIGKMIEATFYSIES